MKRFYLGVLIASTLCGSAFAADPARLCGDFNVFKSPDAVRYVGQFKQNLRPYTIVVAEQLEDGRALVFYVYGKRPGKDRDREGCVIHIGRLKEEGVLFVSFNRSRSISLYLNKGSTEFTRRDRDGYVQARLTGSLERQ